jgi:hypothetical protein
MPLATNARPTTMATQTVSTAWHPQAAPDMVRAQVMVVASATMGSLVQHVTHARPTITIIQRAPIA